MADNVRDRWSDADKIFIPMDLDSDTSLSKYTDYKATFYQNVPEKCVVVRKNFLTGRLSVKKGTGAKFFIPYFTRHILVSVSDKTIDYDKIEYLTQDGIMANIDLALIVFISDPVKYMREGKQQLNQLSVITHSLLRRFVSNKKFNDIKNGHFSIDMFDPYHEFQSFADAYGISIKEVKFKEVELPQPLKEEFEKKEIEKQRKEAQQTKLEADTEKAVAEAKMMDIRTEAEVRRARQLAGAPIQGLKDTGISEETIAQNVGVFGANHSVFIGGNGQNGNDTAKSVAAGVAAGNYASHSNGNVNTSNLDHVQSLKNVLRSLFLANRVSDEARQQYQSLLSQLDSNQELIQLINTLPEVQFNQFTEQVINGKFGEYASENSEQSRGRAR